jgi:4-amino-4-deoxy-L-arabinose transferase-like glycosyltransferase
MHEIKKLTNYQLLERPCHNFFGLLIPGEKSSIKRIVLNFIKQLLYTKKLIINSKRILFLKNNSASLHIITISFLVVIASLLIFFRLGQNTLEDWDEAIYAEVAKEMVNRGDWLTQYYNYQPWFEKPPLQTWLTGLYFSVFNINEFWARAASAFSALFLVIITYFFGCKCFGYRVGLLGAVILLSNYEFLNQSRSGKMDMMLSLFIYLSIAAYLFARRDVKYWYLFWVAFSLAFMTKFWAAGVILIIVIIMLIIDNKITITISSKVFWTGVLFSVSLILPWHLIMLFLHYDQFIERYFLYDLIKRSISGLEGNIGTGMYYWDRLQIRFSPWYLLVPFAMTINLYDHVKKKDRNAGLMILYILIIVVFSLYSFIVQTKLFWYIIPIFPAVSLLISSLIIKAFKSQKSFAFFGLAYASFIALLIATTKQILILVLFSGIIFFGLVIYHYILRKTSKKSINTEYIQIQRLNRLSTRLNSFLNLFSKLDIKELVYKFAVVVMLLLFVGVGLRRSFQLYTYRPSPVAEISKIAGQANPDEPLIGVCFSEDYDKCVFGPTALFYSNRPIIIAWSPEELALITENQSTKEIIIANDLINQLDTEYNFKIMDVVSPFIYGKIEKKLIP